MRDIYVSRFDVRYIIELRASKNMRCDLKMRAIINIETPDGDASHIVLEVCYRDESRVKDENRSMSASHVSTTAQSQSASQRDPVSQYSDASHKRNISHISVASHKLI